MMCEPADGTATAKPPRMVDSNIEFKLKGYRTVRVVKPWKVGYVDSYTSHGLTININPREIIENYRAGRNFLQGGFFKAYYYPDGGHGNRLESGDPIFFSDIIDFYAIEPPPCTIPWCVSNTPNHGGECLIDLEKYVAIKGITTEELVTATTNYLKNLTPAEYLTLLCRVLSGGSIIHNSATKIVTGIR
ncbi:Uncharacterised protein [uncultured archaeon]|nr:Uncharacterised protein [uncultured archaeon]